jgi:1-acyl-sn-glycerol-3-phosphate acyltransferase
MSTAGGSSAPVAGDRLRQLFFLAVVRPVLALVIGLNVRHAERLPRRGPALVVANHNSHLDVFVLMSLFPLRLLPGLRAVAAADYFLRHRALAWFARQVVGIIPIERGRRSAHRDPLAPVEEALGRGQIVILFPEGTRGEPETLGRLQSGVAHLLQRHPHLPATPVFLHGLGKALPRGEALLVPFFCDVAVGEPLLWSGDRRRCIGELRERLAALAAELPAPPWE